MVYQRKEKLHDVKKARKALFKTKNSILLQERREIELNSTETEDGEKGILNTGVS